MTRRRISLAWVFVLVLCGFSRQGIAADTAVPAGGEKRYAKTKEGQPPEPIMVAGDTGCWPNLKRCRDGALVVTGFNQPIEKVGAVEGDVDCWASEDEGQTWQRRTAPAVHDTPKTMRVNHAAGLANNGDLIVVSTGETLPFDMRFLQTWVSRSSDGGRSWSVDKNTFPSAAPDGLTLCPFGEILPGKDGCLHLYAYTVKYPDPKVPAQMPIFRSYIYRSQDDGKTWTEPVLLRVRGSKNKSMNEVGLFHLGGGKWLAAARMGPEYKDCMELFRSNDDAKTWPVHSPLTGELRHPANFLRLEDGRILLSYTNRTKEKGMGVEAATSSDEGKTWSAPIRLIDFELDGGYPSSLQRRDGQIVTAYYAAKIQGHDRCHLGVVIWDLERSLKP